MSTKHPTWPGDFPVRTRQLTSKASEKDPQLSMHAALASAGHRRLSRHRKPSTVSRNAARVAVAPTMAATMLLPAVGAHASTASNSAKTAAAPTTAKTAAATGFKGFASRPTITRVVTAHPTLNVRTNGGPVRWVQYRLGVKATGHYDAATIAAVRKVQAAHGLKQTGVVDNVTWSVMGVRYVKTAAKLSIDTRAPGSATFGNLVLRLASTQQGARYRHGGTGPAGFDCSGFVGYVYRHLGISLPRTAASMRRATKHVSASQVRRGDLVFVYRHGHISHVAIYAGKGLWFEASKPGTPVGLRKAWTHKGVSYGRVSS